MKVNPRSMSAANDFPTYSLLLERSRPKLSRALWHKTVHRSGLWELL
jgi:hypothetical protein